MSTTKHKQTLALATVLTWSLSLGLTLTIDPSAASAAVDPSLVPPEPGPYSADLPAGMNEADCATPACVVVRDAATLISTLSTASSGKTIFVAPGEYTLDRPLTVPSGVTLAGAGMAVTRLRLNPTKWANFAFGFLLTAGPSGGALSSDVTVQDLTVDGSRSEGGATANKGGGIKVGDRWTVQRVRFTDLNYFKIWVLGIADAQLLHNRFDNLEGASSSDNDNIGGGRSTGVLIEGNSFDATLVGNVIDVIGGSGYTVRDNVSRTNSMFFEGVVESVVEGNSVSRGAIVVQSNAVDRQTDSINPRAMTVRRNRITDGPFQGISIVYDAYSGSTIKLPGGGNRIEENIVNRTPRVGIFIVGCANGWKTSPDQIVGNRVMDSMGNGATTFPSGCGTTEAVGIALTIGIGDTVADNDVMDTRTPSLTRYGYNIGAIKAPTTVQTTTVSGNTGSGWTLGLVQYGATYTP